MDKTLQSFEYELDALKRSLEEFETKHPQKAKSLGVSAGKCLDPNIQRLSDSFAFLAARLSSQIDENHPKMALDLLRMISPLMLLGAPTYCSFALAYKDNKLEGKQNIKKGQEITVPVSENFNCTYSVAQDTTIHPIEITALSLDVAPFGFDIPNCNIAVKSSVSFEVTSLDLDQEVSELDLEELEFYLPMHSARRSYLWKAFTSDIVSVSIGKPSEYPLYWLSPNTFECLALGSQNNFLPSVTPLENGTEYLRDFLSYPEKFAFFVLRGLKEAISKIDGSCFQIRFYLSTKNIEPLINIELGDVKINVLGCINYFQRTSVPTQYSFARDRVPVFPTKNDSKEPVEVLSIIDLIQLTPKGDVELKEMHSPLRKDSDKTPVWQEHLVVGNLDPLRREVSFSVPSMLTGPGDSIDFNAKMLCSNGHAASAPRPGNQAFLTIEEADAILFFVLDEPTKQIEPDFAAARQWDLMSVITSSLSTFFDSPEPVQWLKKIFNLCSPSGYSEDANAIWDVTIQRSIAPLRVGDGTVLATGNKVEIIIVSDALSCVPVVFAHVLNSFLSNLVSYDRFLQLTLRERGSNLVLIKLPRTHGSQA